MSVVRTDHTLEFPAVIANTTSPKPPNGGEGWKFAFLLIGLLILLVACASPRQAHAARPSWQVTQASYYNPTGNGTACGTTMNRASWHVASLGGSKAECGDRLTICHDRRCVHVTVLDTGGYHAGRKWDLTPRVKAALRCGDVCQVKWGRR